MQNSVKRIALPVFSHHLPHTSHTSRLLEASQLVITMDHEETEENPEEEGEKSPSPTPNQGQQGKAAKKPAKKKERGRRNREICDVFGDAAMTNAYYICHNVQDFLYCRGFPWNPKK